MSFQVLACSGRSHGHNKPQPLEWKGLYDRTGHGEENHVFLYVVHALGHFDRVQLFVTSWIVAHQTPLTMGFSRQEYWSGLPRPPPGIFLTLGQNLHLLIAGRFFTTKPMGKPPYCCMSLGFPKNLYSCVGDSSFSLMLILYTKWKLWGLPKPASVLRAHLCKHIFRNNRGVLIPTWSHVQGSSEEKMDRWSYKWTGEQVNVVLKSKTHL